MVDLKPISDFVIDELRKTLAIQGHNLTGKLANSIEAYTLDVLNGYLIRFYWEDYGVPLDTGVPAANIKFSPGSGAKSSKYIDGLVKYVKQRMNVSGDKEALGIAFAIAYKQKEQGMSTDGSKRFSKTGKRNEWVDNTLDRVETELFRLIENQLYTLLDDIFTQAFTLNRA